jgi:hypothetical protein
VVAGEARDVGAGVAVEDADDGAEGRGGLEAALVLEHLVGLGDGDGGVARVAAREVAPPEEPVAALRAGGGVPRRGGQGTAARREEPDDRAQHAPATSPTGGLPEVGGTGGAAAKGVVRWWVGGRWRWRGCHGGGRNRTRARKNRRTGVEGGGRIGLSGRVRACRLARLVDSRFSNPFSSLFFFVRALN